MSKILDTFMVKSLGDYNKEKSSTTNFKNIKWTKKKPTDFDKPRRKNKKKISPTNIIIRLNSSKISKPEKKIYKIEEIPNKERSKKEITYKKSQKSSVANSKIKPGFKRPGR